jgi:lipid-binding SYLF domain-containing protein
MKRFFVILAMLALLALTGTAQAQQESQVERESSKTSKQFAKATDVLNEIMRARDKGIPQDLLDKAVCVRLVPSEITLAFGVRGSYERGVLVCREHGSGPGGSLDVQVGRRRLRSADWRQGD